jgi:beta-galactosidase GanA
MIIQKQVAPIVLLLLCYCTFSFAQTNKSLPILVKANGRTQLNVDQKPFLILGGELSNSSTSSMQYMTPIWPKLKLMHLNTVLAPVYWELMEPAEGKFDFALVDSMIQQAGRSDLKLVFLWFGAWKNSMSCYAPLWMKTNAKRFPRTNDTTGRSQEIFSVFGKETLEADKKAFTALMKHIRETDATRTVIMMQVENEIGMLPTAREFSTIANNLFNEKVPAELMNQLQKNKNNLVPELSKRWEQQGFKINDTWENTFGKGLATDEIFQAWYYANYTNAVAAAGKKEYDLPMYVNAALPRPGKLPGQYPSAGPLPHLMDVWKAVAPSLDMLSPDFYNPSTKYWCDLYTRNNNTLFVPEIQFDNTVAAKAFFIIGHYKALGFSPFSIESDNKASLALSKSYDVLHQLTPVIVNGQLLNMDGFLLDKQNKSVTVNMGRYNLMVSHQATLSWSSEAKDSVWSTTGGIVLQTGADEFLVGGNGIVVTFENTDKNFVTNIASVDEVSYKNGVEVKGRRMNGDQDHQGRHVRFEIDEWGIQKVKLYNSPASVE